MHNFAIIATGGKQIKVAVGDKIYIEKIDIEADHPIIFSKVLMIDGKVGTPLLPKAKVRGTVIKHGRQKKIIVFKYKPKKDSHKKQGHRQDYTQVRIEEISLTGKFATPKKVTKEITKAAKPTPVTPKTNTSKTIDTKKDSKSYSTEAKKTTTTTTKPKLESTVKKTTTANSKSATAVKKTTTAKK